MRTVASLTQFPHMFFSYVTLFLVAMKANWKRKFQVDEVAAE